MTEKQTRDQEYATLEWQYHEAELAIKDLVQQRDALLKAARSLADHLSAAYDEAPKGLVELQEAIDLCEECER